MTSTTELRVALTVDDRDAAVAFYRQVLGVESSAHWTRPAGNVGVFELPRATLEHLDREAAAAVDDFEAGQRVSGSVRLALRVADAAETYATAEAAGAGAVGSVKLASWGDRVGRVESPAGMQLTLSSEA